VFTTVLDNAEDNNKIDVKETEHEVVDWTQLDYDMVSVVLLFSW
jgi:hypothetical protein